MEKNDSALPHRHELGMVGSRSSVRWGATVGHTSIVIEPMTEMDIPAVSEVDAECFPTHWSLRSYHRELENPASVYLVVRADSQVVGFAGMWISGDEAHITTLGVRQTHRRQGIGSRLLAALLCAARAAGATRVTLEVRESNAAAIALYRSFGFEDVGARPRYYETEDARIMWLYDLGGAQVSARVRDLLSIQDPPEKELPTSTGHGTDC